MQKKYSSILQTFCRYGVFNCLRCRQKHTSDAVPFLGQPTGYTHPYLMKKDEITPGISHEEYTQRRTNLINLLRTTHYGDSQDNHIIILTASQEYHMAPDVPYPFRQNSNFLYLTGYQEPDAVLVLEIGKNSTSGLGYNSILFTRLKDPSREIWDGPRSGVEGAVQHFGFNEAYPINELAENLKKRNNNDLNVWYDHLEPVHLYLNKEITDVLFNTPEFKFSRIHHVGHLVEALRVLKSPAEISLLKKCTSITSQAKVKAMRKTKPGVPELYLHSVLEHESRKLGAQRLSFPPVVAGGSMANTLHYISNNQILQDGQLVLVDSGCEYHGYSSDVTRVWPVNGKFSKVQKELYEVLLNIQKNCIKMCHVGTTLEHVYQGMLSFMENEFEALGLIPKGLQPHHKRQHIRNICPHHVGHYIGMDVHDTGSVSRNLPFREGMVITIEPGVYIRENENLPPRLLGIGIRIEDDVLITDNGPVVLTSSCPKDVDGIENIMATVNIR